MADIVLAFDDQTSTFIIPSGAGFEVVFCPGARSTVIIDTSLDQMLALSQHGRVDKQTAMSMMQKRQEMFKSSAVTRAFWGDNLLLMVVCLMVVVVSSWS